MIATGGLLRINARSRQESLKSRTHKPPGHKRKGKKRSSEVVVVKAKVKLMSLSGVVAALGVLVLLAGLLLAALGYWPRHGLLFSLRPQGGATTATSSTPAPSHIQVGGVDGTAEQTGSVNGTAGFLAHFLDRYLHSDRLKVLGPLVMGVGIFLFICANAVLHEERDRHTRVINLRDVYSTVIDLHRRPGSAPIATPPTHLVNYSQATSLESRARSFPTSLQRGREGGGAGAGRIGGAAAGGEAGRGEREGRNGGAEARGRGAGGAAGVGSGDGGGGGGRTGGATTAVGGGGRAAGGREGAAAAAAAAAGGGGAAGGVSVFTLYQEVPDAPPPSHSLFPLPFAPSPQEEELRIPSLPCPRPPPPAASCRRHSAGAAAAATGRAVEEQPCFHSSPHLHQEVPTGSLEALLLLCTSLAMPPSVNRRRSLPCAPAVYCKLLDSVTSLHYMTSRRKCSNQESTHKSYDFSTASAGSTCCRTVGRHSNKEPSKGRETGPALPLDQSAASV